MLLQILISVVLGLLPEVLYFTMFLICTKDIKEKRIKLGLLISIAYVLCMFIQKYKVIYYVLFIALVYAILKLLYKEKTQIIDIFVISISTIPLTLLSLIYFGINKYFNYYVLLIFNRILLFLPFIFNNKFNLLYKKYCSLWNRNDYVKRPIKSITLRNISLIIINLLIFIINIVIMKILTIA